MYTSCNECLSLKSSGLLIQYFQALLFSRDAEKKPQLVGYNIPRQVQFSQSFPSETVPFCATLKIVSQNAIL